MAYSNLYARFYAGINKAAKALGDIFRYRPSIVYSVFTIIFQAVAWWQAWFIRRHLSGSVLVLHYNVDFGIDRVGKPSLVFLYPLFGLAVFLFNLIILAVLHKEKSFKAIAHFLLAAAALFGLFSCLALLAVYLINFR